MSTPPFTQSSYGLKPVNISELRSVIDQLDAKLIPLAMAKGIGGNIATNLVVRDLLPFNDMAASGSIEYFEQQVSSGAYTTPNYSGTNPNDRLIAIYGYRNNAATPRTVKIRFWEETGRVAIVDIWDTDKWNSYGAEADVAFITSNPIIYLPNRGFNIDQYGRSAGTDNVVYLGRVVEPRSKLIKGSSAGPL